MQAPRADARPLGVVYTPPAVAAPMVRLALAPLLAGRTAAQILALRICDPAIGEGAFLAAAIDLVAAHLAALGCADARARAATCMVGVDIDARAVDAARARTGSPHLRVADALDLDWRAAFPDAPHGFDAVIGNPPYVRQEHLLAHKPHLRAFASYAGVADLYVYFLELAHRIARPGGRYCLVTPNKWLTAAYARPLRAFLADAASVEGVVDLGRGALFADADAFPCIVWGTVGGARGPIRAARATDVAALDAVGAPHARDRWRAEPWHIDAPDDRALIDRLCARWPALGDAVPERPARGVVTGCNRAFVLDAEARARLLDAEPAAAPLIRPFAKGRDLARWRPRAAERWILLVDRGTSLAALPHVEAHLARHRTALEPRPPAHAGAWPGRKPGAYRWCELQDPVGPLATSGAPRLLYQDIQTAPICCVAPPDLVPDTTVWMLPSADLFLLAILNSPIYAFYARRRFPPALNGSVRPKQSYLRALPIAQPSPDLRAAVEQLVQRCLAGDLATEPQIHALLLDAYELSAAERALI